MSLANQNVSVIAFRIRAVLNRQWNPMSDCPEDEYHACVNMVASMLRNGSSDDALHDYLNWVETVRMRFPRNRGRLRIVVAAIQALDRIG
jgi:hypothetical protein